MSDAAIWLLRTKVVAEMQDVKLAVLYHVSYAVYDGLAVEYKKDAKKIEEVMLQVFYLNAYAAYELCTKQKMSNEERVDVFFADHNCRKRVSCLAKLPDEGVRLMFVVGLPEAVSARLRTSKETIDVMFPKVRTTLNLM